MSFPPILDTLLLTLGRGCQRRDEQLDCIVLYLSTSTRLQTVGAQAVVPLLKGAPLLPLFKRFTSFRSFTQSLPKTRCHGSANSRTGAHQGLVLQADRR